MVEDMKHRHHIVPKYEGGSNLQENIVLLSITQHAMWHYAEWNRKKNTEDYLAWRSLSGQISKAESQVLKSKLGWIKMKEITKDQPHPATQLKGRKQSPEHIQKRISQLRGKTRDPEMVDRMRQTKRKLTDDQVREIRSSTEKGIVLAEIYNVAPSSISQIRNNKAPGYKHII